jgi:hypothetical protein
MKKDDIKRDEIAPIPLPICAECAYANEYNDVLACFRQKPTIDLIDGSEIFPKPKICRIERAEMVWAWWACGKKGRFFIKKEDAITEKAAIEKRSQ